MLQTVLFYTFSLGIIALALGVILSRRPVYSVLCLVSAMCLIAGLFVLLKAFFVATVLVLVYAGAILVLFLFVVMFIDFEKMAADWQGFRLSPFLAAILGILLFAECFWVIQNTAWIGTPALDGSTQAIGRMIFSTYLLPFELTSFLLLAAVISVVVLAKKDSV